MERLWLANLAPGTTDEEVKALIRKYAPDLECSDIQQVAGDGSRPAVMIMLTGKRIDSLGKLKLRLDGMFWKGRRLACSTTVL
jgi:hypothetical protein